MVAGDNVEKNSSSKIDMANYSLRRLAKVQFPNKCFALKKKTRALLRVSSTD